MFCEFGDNHFGNNEVNFGGELVVVKKLGGVKVNNNNNQMYGGSVECL